MRGQTAGRMKEETKNASDKKNCTVVYGTKGLGAETSQTKN